MREENSIYSDLQGVGYGNLCSIFDGMGDEDGGGLGFLEMLGVQEVQIPLGWYMFDEMSQREVLYPSRIDHNQVAVGDELLPLMKNGVSNKQFDDGTSNAPGTPNSSSISSASHNEGVVLESELEKAEEDKEEDKEEEQDLEGSGKKKKQLKAKKGNLKKQKQARFAFMTKSEVDHLEDGYRWRKYGQKAVKNSPFPRSYYRCTSASCGVKKRVERSCTDSSIVMTTYEGQHTHPSPLTHRGLSSSAVFQDSIMPTLMHHHMNLQQIPSYFNNYNSYNASPAPTSSFTQGDHHGMLQDLIPSLAPKEEEY
ncbi:unnamed protein product [Rhodiola kirilowii]